MNNDEAIVKRFLENQFLKVVHEPDGKIPPDFLVDDAIAVEVRRLNQNYHYENGQTKGLEEDWIPLWQKFEKLIFNYGAPTNGKSWYIGMDFTRPIEKREKLAPKIKKILKNIEVDQPREIKPYYVTENFTIDAIPTSKKYDTMFRMGASSDGDSGGFVLSELEKNLILIINEKTGKIKKHKEKYKTWWLILTDHIGYGLDEEDRKQFKQYINVNHEWDRVILLNPLNIESYFEI